MVTAKQKFSHLPDGTIDVDAWLQKISAHYHLKQTDLLSKTCNLALLSSKGITTFYGQPCLEQSLEMAEIILDLGLDEESAAAAIIASIVQHTRLTLEEIKEKLNDDIANLIISFLQMNAINSLADIKSRDAVQIDRLRKILLAMVSDIRVVLVKLAERLCIMRGIKKINTSERKYIAQETMDVYAPLANRLGVGQLKWELEDIAFHYINPETYKTIAAFLAERRGDRETRIDNIILKLKTEFLRSNITAKFSGRAKHIYSIYIKMQRKHLDYKNIYDQSAIRIIVPTMDDCYAALSIVHGLWEHIPDEFDDYISHPKPNGYRSIHTAVIDEDGKGFEIQIRTQEMHALAEHGVAAHWLYKENKSAANYETKINFLRQLLAWHKDVAHDDKLEPSQNFLDDRVYVFTPAGAIIDLPTGATPLDFAYHIHSELGNRCRGAKINAHIVPLTYQLQTGDQVEIITVKNGTPSRDWLNKELGYLKTSRARSKVAHWFKLQDINQHIEMGRDLLERELSRAGLHQMNFQKIANRFNFKDESALFAALGRGNLKAAQIVHTFEQEEKISLPAASEFKPHAVQTSFGISGSTDLLTRIARCCKPIPGDAIIGYITQGRGVSIHRKECNNISSLSPLHGNRLIDVNWDQQKVNFFYVDLQILVFGKENILREISALIANFKIDLAALNSSVSKKNNLTYVSMTVQIQNLAQLKELITHLKQLPNVADIKRIK